MGIKAEKIEFEAPRTAKDKDRAAELAVSEIEKKYGKGAILKLGKKSAAQKVPSIPTGIYGLDNYGIQTGGFPRGRVIEIFGPESGGKTTLLLRAIARAQAMGEKCAFIDAEHAFDPAWAAKQGVIVDELYVSQPDYGEQALDIAEFLITSGAFAIVGVDSVAALVPKAELDGEMGDSNMGLQARMMSQAMRKLTGIVSKSNTCLVFINQIREKIGVMFGSPETTTGGRALKFYASVRIDVRRIAWVKEGEEVVGAKVKLKVVKNKVGSPFRETECDLLFASGWNAEGDVLDQAVEAGIVDKSGAWYSYKTDRIGQGRNSVCDFLRGNNVIYQKIYKELEAFDGKAKEEITA